MNHAQKLLHQIETYLYRDKQNKKVLGKNRAGVGQFTNQKDNKNIC